MADKICAVLMVLAALVGVGGLALTQIKVVEWWHWQVHAQQPCERHAHE